MDSLSHALVGIAVAGLSGHPLSLYDPLYIATILGAQAPDFDILTILKGNFTYIKQHRSFSHSIPGVFLWTLLITICMCFFLPQENGFALFPWAFAGGLSHIIIDYCNTHGAAILWPFCKRRKSLQLLNVTDPLLIFLMISVYPLHLTTIQLSMSTFLIITLYILLRFFLRQKGIQQLKTLFPTEQITQLAIMPSLKRIFFWDFVIETQGNHLVGQLGALCPVVEINATFPKQKPLSKFTRKAKETPLGSFFTTFTPFHYFEEHKNEHTTSVTIYDLRYNLNKEFIHRGTIIFDDNELPEASYMYSYGRTMKISC